MCGIGAYSIAPGTELDASLLTKLLLAGLAERGEDACGYAWRVEGTPRVEVVKRNLPPHEFLASVPVRIPPTVRDGIVHVRDFTKGRPNNNGNNHPIRHGSIVGVHNGIIQNDDELFEQFGRERSLPGMSVDSEAIFMLLDAMPTHSDTFPLLIGSYTTAFFDERDRQTLTVAKGRGRPLLQARGDGFVLFASTRNALQFAANRLRVSVAISPVHDGTLLRLRDGVVADRERIDVHDFTESPTMRYNTSVAHARLARDLADDALGGGPLPGEGPGADIAAGTGPSEEAHAS
jgi:glucosamine 6-phosphate synthetase-like amidotransferase/phosphosugar isomerase protein